MKKFLIFIALSFAMLSTAAITAMMFSPEMVGTMSAKVAVSSSIVALLFTVLLGLDSSNSKSESVVLTITLVLILGTLTLTASFVFTPEMVVSSVMKFSAVFCSLLTFIGLFLWIHAATADEAKLYA